MKRLYKSEENKVLTGVLGGIGEYFEVDPTLVRVAFLLLAIITAFIPAAICYFIAAIVVPPDPETVKNTAKAKAKLSV